jgi:outer membrane protein
MRKHLLHHSHLTPALLLWLLAAPSLVAAAPVTAPATALAPLPQATPVPDTATAAADALKMNTAEVNLPMAAQTEQEDSFKAMLEATYQNNPRIQAARQQLQATDENMAIAASGFRPSFAAGFDTGQSRAKSGDNPSNSGYTENQEIRGEQPLFRGGSVWSNFKASQDRSRAGQAQLMAVEQSVLLDAITAYMDVLSSQAILELSRNNRDVLEKQLKASQDRFEVGEVTRTDVAQSQARLAQARTNVISAEGALLTSLAVFERLVGYKPATTLYIPQSSPPLPLRLEEAIEMARAANPDLMSALRIEQATKRDIDSAFGTLLPQVTLVGSATRQRGPSRLGDTTFDQDMMMVNFRVPLYQSGSEYAKVRQAKANARQQKHAAMETEAAMQENVARAWERMQTSIATITERNDEIKAAQIALEGVKLEEEYGARTVLDVLDAEQELFSAQTNLVRAERERVIALYSLLLTIGQLTPDHLELGIASYDPTEHFDNTRWKFIGF